MAKSFAISPQSLSLRMMLTTALLAVVFFIPLAAAQESHIEDCAHHINTNGLQAYRACIAKKMDAEASNLKGKACSKTTCIYRLRLASKSSKLGSPDVFGFKTRTCIATYTGFVYAAILDHYNSIDSRGEHEATDYPVTLIDPSGEPTILATSRAFLGKHFYVSGKLQNAEMVSHGDWSDCGPEYWILRVPKS